MVTLGDIRKEPEAPCPACGTMKWSKAGQVKDYSVSGEWFDLFLCEGCRLKMTFPPPPPEKLGGYYASQDYISHSDTQRGLINQLYHRARRYMLGQKRKWVELASGKSTGSLLDVGAGTGYFAHFMKEAGWKVTALEPDQSAREVAKAKLNFEILPLESLAQLSRDAFDVITLWHVLEHVADLNGYMSHFHELLSADGTLMIAVPNHESVDAQHYQQHWAAYDVPRHLWHFSHDAVRQLCSRHAFEVKEIRTMPLDGFYVSMLSEKYRGSDSGGMIAAAFQGFKSWRKGNRHPALGSSVIYIAKKK